MGLFWLLFDCGFWVVLGLRSCVYLFSVVPLVLVLLEFLVFTDWLLCVGLKLVFWFALMLCYLVFGLCLVVCWFCNCILRFIWWFGICCIALLSVGFRLYLVLWWLFDLVPSGRLLLSCLPCKLVC